MAKLLPELDTTSVLEIVEKNFKEVGLKTYALRMVYAGEHGVADKEEFVQQMRIVIQAVNVNYCDINVQGLLLVYDSYFVHILEGSEDTVFRQLRFMFQQELVWIQESLQRDKEAHVALVQAAIDFALEEGIPYVAPPEPEIKTYVMFKKLKILMVYHTIKTLNFDCWRAVIARPPSLVGRLDVNAPLAQHMEQLRICLDKITKLCGMAKVDDLNFEGLSAADPKMDALPEVALLDFLLQSKHVMDLRHTVFLHRRVDDYVFYHENVWPLPTQFTPQHLYKLKIDDSFVEPLPVMPWELVKKETNEDEDQEKQSSSDSD